jgi:hypothetical protein
MQRMRELAVQAAIRHELPPTDRRCTSRRSRNQLTFSKSTASPQLPHGLESIYLTERSLEKLFKAGAMGGETIAVSQDAMTSAALGEFNFERWFSRSFI